VEFEKGAVRSKELLSKADDRVPVCEMEKRLDIKTAEVLILKTYIVHFFKNLKGGTKGMKRLKGFTLIELLIVVAIIAILAAIAVPNFLEAQVRSKVSRAKSDLRTIAVGLEAYYVDNNTYVGSGVDQGAQGLTVNSMLAPPPNISNGGNASGRLTFQTFRPLSVDGRGRTITTPIAYLNSLFVDPFADTRAAIYGYFSACAIGSNSGWMMWSYGPDTDEAKWNGQIQHKLVNIAWAVVGQSAPPQMIYETFYNPSWPNPSYVIKGGQYPETGTTGKAYTYDPTNGTNSPGDVWRLKEGML